MLNRLRLFRFRRISSPDEAGLGFTGLSFAPRLWMVLLLLAVPFIAVSGSCFEVLERSGSWGATVANVLFSASIAGYIILVGYLKHRNK